MDPLTIWLFCLATAWFIRRAVEDGWAAARGRESPRLARRRTQHELAQRHQADTGTPTIGRAVAGRVAARIAEPRPRGAMRRYLAELWEDGWVDAADSHRTRRERKRRAQVGADPDEVVLESRPCPGGCGRWVAGELPLCSACLEDRYEWPTDTSEASDPHDAADDWAAAEPDPDDDSLEAEILDLDPHSRPVDLDEPDPEPSPAPEPDRKGTPPMTTSTTINGDTVSPLENLGYADACQKFNAEVFVKLDTIANNLAGAGVGDGFLQILRDVGSAAMDYDQSIERSKTVYARHVHHQAELAQDTDLADTLAGTYLARATV